MMSDALVSARARFWRVALPEGGSRPRSSKTKSVKTWRAGLTVQLTTIAT
jgi:hypothetical protein